ncbi:MAG: ATP-dependent helicase, partial [Desulfurobacteriaceae bacterium]
FLIQNRIDEGELIKEKDLFLRVSGEVLKKYREVSEKESFLDYTLLEELFLKFLTSKEGKIFLKGDGTEYFPGIRFILVDEYQDTNPLDEEIYFTLSSSTLNLTVVGDEDQALYRFRGAVVECFVNFEDSFKERFNRKPKVIKLLRNYRSNKVIVDFLNHFMGKHKEGRLKGAWRELSSSKELLFSSGIDSTTTLPKAVLKVRRNRRELARFCLELVKSLKEEGIIESYSDVVLLLPTTRELRGGGRKSLAGYVRELFEKEGIPVYNPRSKAFKEKREVKALIWALSQVVPRPTKVDTEVLKYLDSCSGEFELPKEDLKTLREISHSLKAGLLELFYRLLSLFDFSSREEKFNLAQLSSYLYYIENFARGEVEKGKEARELNSFTKLNGRDLDKDELCRLISFHEFYSTFLYLFVRGEVDQRELPKVPENSFPIMTIHQSKGLEFPIVIVGEVGSSSPDFRLGKLEEIFSKYLKRNQVKGFERGVVDSVKKFFVAYSR